MLLTRRVVCCSLLACTSWLAGCDLAPPPPTRAEEAPSALSVPLRAANAETAQLYRIVETYFDEYLALNPIRATELGDHRFDDRFGDYVSMSWMADSLGIEQEALERLQALDPKQLSGEDRLSYEAFKRQRELGIASYRYPSELLAIDPFDSWPGVFAQLGSGQGAHPFRTTQDYDNFLARMDGFVAWVDQAINNLRAGVSKGVVLPKVLVERTLPQLEAVGRLDDPRQTVFWQPLLNFPAGPTIADRRRLLQAYDEKLRTRVLPAYRRLHDYLAQEYLPKARETVAWSDLPSGDLWYAYLVRRHTTTELTPAEVHELGLREVARLRTRLAAMRWPPGVAGDPRAAYDAMRLDDSLNLGDANASLAGYTALRAQVEARLSALFARRPRTVFEIRAVESFRTSTAAVVSYQPPSADGQRPGVFFVNTSELASRAVPAMAAQYLHEAVPGHLFQVSLAQETPDLPRFRRFGHDTAYAEAWAAYAESLGGELGILVDPASQFGVTSRELSRASRLVVDSGLHSRDWSRQRALDYLRANTALGEADIANVVDQCIAHPGKGLAGTLGRLHIERLRQRAEQKLGERFDVRAFHEQVVGGGSLPLSVIEAKIARWTEARR